MICTHCGHSVEDGALTCDNCGTYLGRYASTSQDSGVRAIRQGRVSASAPTLAPRTDKVREYGDYELNPVPLSDERTPRRKPQSLYGKSGSSRPDTRRGVPVRSHVRTPAVRPKTPRAHSVRRHNINWMLIGLIAVVVLLAGGITAYVLVTRSENGQLAIARRNTLSASESLFALSQNTRDPLVQDERKALLDKWNSASAQSYWQSGQYYLDLGDVQTAIVSLRIGDVIDPDNYDGLLLLANAYELNAQDDMAEQVYLRLAREVSPFRSEAFTALIRLYQGQGRRPEAAEMMREAYQKTDRESFRLEREDYIPETPQISLNAGRYEIGKLEGNVMLSSVQNYDIYYTTEDDAVLPQEGILSIDGSFVPREGSVTLRAVCVSGDLVSDELKVSYTFFYPSPPAPKCNLAPNTYKTLREVSLRPGEIRDEKLKKAERAEIESHYVYYYTIDGSTPTEESPKYDGTPIKLPPGRVTLKAVCVNQYGKMSSILEVSYKFNVKYEPVDPYREADVFGGFVLNKTTPEQFKTTFGQPKQEVDTNYLGLNTAAVHYDYDWGYAVFVLNGSAWELVRIQMDRSIATPPRGVGFGSTENEISDAYKDFRQIASPDGTRGLYYAYPEVGQILYDTDGTRMVQYMCPTVAGNNWVLQYRLHDGRVNQIIHYYQP